MKENSIIIICLIFLSCNIQGVSQSKNSKDKLAEQCIEDIIARDDVLGSIRNRSCEEISLSETILNYVKEIEKMDFSYCPKYFKVAFTRHIQAWKDMIPVTDHFPTLRGEMHDLFEQIDRSDHGQAYKTVLSNIWSTWDEVEEAMK